MNVLLDNIALFRKGFVGTVELTALSALIAVMLGVVMAALRVSPVPPLRFFGTAWVTLFRNTPLTLLFFISVLVLPQLGLNKWSFFQLAVLALSCYTSAFICEAVRSGINTVPLGQAEAARAIGLPFLKTLRYVVLPQAFRGAIAPLGNVLIALTKNSTVASVIGVTEASAVMKVMIENRPDVLFVVFGIFALGFVILTLPVGVLFTSMSKRLAVKR